MTESASSPASRRSTSLASPADHASLADRFAPTSRAKPDTSFLNLFRGLAALYVLLAHCGIFAAAGRLPEPRLAVDLFMILSGFLMMYTVDRSRSGWRSFYVKRLFRLAPAYYLALLLAFLLTEPIMAGYWTFMDLNPAGWPPDRTLPDFTATNIALHVTFLFGLFPDYAFATTLPDWSIGLEMQFYAVFPLLYVAYRRLPVIAFTLVVVASTLCLSYLYARGVSAGHLKPFPHPSLLIFRLPVFLAGMLIYKGGLRHMTAAVAILLLASIDYGWIAVTLAAAGVVIWWCWTRPVPARFTAFTRSRAVSFLADCSYSVYLLHGIVLSILGSRVFVFLLAQGLSKQAAVAILMLVVVIVTYAVSWVVHRTIEGPGIAWGRRLASRIGRRG